MDQDSFLRLGEHGNIMTNCNIKNEYGQLPLPTMPSKYQLAHGDPVVEDNMRYRFVETNRKSCNPFDSEFYSRYFYIFNDKVGIQPPDALQSVETNSFGPRGGQSTRFLHQTKNKQ
jgi:hypothetical protein